MIAAGLLLSSLGGRFDLYLGHGLFMGLLGNAGINIATFHLGRDAPGANAIALVEVDGDVPPDVLAKVQALPDVQQAKPLRF